MGVNIISVAKVFPAGCCWTPDMKFANSSRVVTFVRVRRRFIPVGRLLLGTRRFLGPAFLRVLGAFLFPLKRFLEPAGRNLPLASLGSVLASRFPLSLAATVVFLFFLFLSLGMPCTEHFLPIP